MVFATLYALPKQGCIVIDSSTGNGRRASISYKPVIQDIPSMGGQGYGTETLPITIQNLTKFPGASSSSIPCSPCEAASVEEVA